LKNLFKIKTFENEQGLVLKFRSDLSTLITEDLEKLCVETVNKNKSLLWLPVVKDLQNVASIVRSAVSFGTITGLILPRKGSPALNAAFCKASAGSVFKSKISFYNSSEKSLELFKHLGFKTIGVSSNFQSSSLKKLEDFCFKKDFSYLFVLGEESKGIPLGILRKLEQNVFIHGAHSFESLNLSVAAGIVLYEFSKISENYSHLTELNDKNAKN